MNKKLYYVVEKELSGNGDDNDCVEYTTGNKTVTVYKINDSKLSKVTDIDLSNEDSSVEAIQNYLSDNGHGDEKFELIQL